MSKWLRLFHNSVLSRLKSRFFRRLVISNVHSVTLPHAPLRRILVAVQDSGFYVASAVREKGVI
jgi:hypothetical protein